MRIFYFADGDWGAKALAGLVEEGNDVCGVVQRVQPTDDKLGLAAREYGIPAYQPRNCNDIAFIEIVEKASPELNISVSYDQYLKAPIRESAPLGFVNFHAGKLPLYRGRSVINWALINGEEEIGLTAHFVDSGIDTGDILLQRVVAVQWADDYATVLSRVVAEFPKLVKDAVRLLASGSAQRQPQADLVGSYFPRRGPGDEWIDWTDTSRNIYNKIRGISSPGPGARTMLEGHEIVIQKAVYDPEWPRYIAIPGQVVGLEPNGVRIKTGDSTLLANDWSEVDSKADGSIRKLRIGNRLLEKVDTQYQMLLDIIARLQRGV